MSETHKKIAVGFIVVAILGVLWIFGRPKRAEAITNKREYPVGSELVVSIQNNLGRGICFSECYPYFLQKNGGDTGNWQNYEYGKCQDFDAAIDCVQDRGFKEFRLPLEDVDPGLNRLMIPVCLGCQTGDKFNRDTAIYSNTFQVR